MRAGAAIGALLWLILFVLALVAFAGCGAFFINLGLLIQCGPMPMGWSDCQPPRPPPRVQRPTNAPMIDDTPAPRAFRGRDSVSHPEDYR